MYRYREPEIVIHHISTLLVQEDPSKWRVGQRLIKDKSLGNPYELGVAYMIIYPCTP